MQFLYPSFLYALSALAIPVIIHLFSFRRYKKVFFTNVRFLADVQKEHSSQNRIKHLILLILRMLALACLVIAFAHPFIPQKNALLNPGKKYVSVYIDNSFSMTNEGSQGPLLDQARRLTNEIVKGYNDADEFQLVTNDFEVKHHRWLNKADFLHFVNETSVSPTFRSVSEVMGRLKENYRNTETHNRDVYLLSDFQENMADFEAIKSDTGLDVRITQLKAAKRNNLYIDSVWFESPVWQLGQTNTLVANISNSSDQAVEDGSLNLKINKSQKPPVSFNIPADGHISVKIPFQITEEGQNIASLSIEDYPVIFDNQFYFNFKVEKSIPVLIINAGQLSDNIMKALSAEKTFNISNVNQNDIDYSLLPRYRFIILNEVSTLSSGLAASLKDFMKSTGNVLVVPPALGMDYAQYSSFLGALSANSYTGAVTNTQAIAAIDDKNPFFSNVFSEPPRNISMPSVTQYYRFGNQAGSMGNELLKLGNGDPFISMIPEGKGYLYISAIPYSGNWSNYAGHSLFLPILFKMAFYHHQEDLLYYTIDKDNYLQLPVQTETKEYYRLVKDSLELTPDQRMIGNSLNLFVQGIIRLAGQYKLAVSKTNTTDAPVYSFNYNRKESVMKFLSADILQEKSASLHPKVLEAGKISFSHQIEEMKAGTKVWKWFLISALLCIMGEALIIRFRK